jgi:hypothetical protein
MVIVASEYLVSVEEESAKWALGIAGRYEVELPAKTGERVPAIVSAKPLSTNGALQRGVLSVLIALEGPEAWRQFHRRCF